MTSSLRKLYSVNMSSQVFLEMLYNKGDHGTDDLKE